MKRSIGKAVLLIIMAGQNAKAQNLKFGHINSDELIQDRSDDGIQIVFHTDLSEILLARY